MIGIILQQGTGTIEVRVDGTNVSFRTESSPGFTTIDNLRLSKSGVIKEFPELKENPKWRNVAIEKFKEKIKMLHTEAERVKYIIEDLGKHGYDAVAMQKQGHRIIKLKDGK